MLAFFTVMETVHSYPRYLRLSCAESAETKSADSGLSSFAVAISGSVPLRRFSVLDQDLAGSGSVLSAVQFLSANWFAGGGYRPFLSPIPDGFHLLRAGLGQRDYVVKG